MTALPTQALSQAGSSPGPHADSIIAPYPHGTPHVSAVSRWRTNGAQSQIFRQAGGGRTPTIVIAGFLPDATESIEYQRTCSHGTATSTT